MRKHILSAIQAPASAEYLEECCGLLLAIGRKQQYYPCRNISTEPNEELRIDPEQYAAAEDIGEIIDIVHSHPDATSRLSPRDLAMCEATPIPGTFSAGSRGIIERSCQPAELRC
jgi:proteasome lid subunit RPN8/RPN11